MFKGPRSADSVPGADEETPSSPPPAKNPAGRRISKELPISQAFRRIFPGGRPFSSRSVITAQGSFFRTFHAVPKRPRRKKRFPLRRTMPIFSVGSSIFPRRKKFFPRSEHVFASFRAQNESGRRNLLFCCSAKQQNNSPPDALPTPVLRAPSWRQAAPVSPAPFCRALSRWP